MSGYAQCVYAAPRHFVLHGREALVYDTAPDDADRAAIERAAQACPVRAITACADDPADDSADRAAAAGEAR